MKLLNLMFFLHPVKTTYEDASCFKTKLYRLVWPEVN